MNTNKKCQAIHESGTECARSGAHPKHIGGLGANRVIWENEDYRPLPKPLKYSEMAHLVKAIRRGPVPSPPRAN